MPHLSGTLRSAGNINGSVLSPTFAPPPAPRPVYPLATASAASAPASPYKPLSRKLLANANPHIGIALFRRRLGRPCDEGRGGGWDRGGEMGVGIGARGRRLAFAYSSAVLPSTFPATHPPRNSAETRRCGHALTLDRSSGSTGEGEKGGRCRGQQSCISSLDS